MAKLTAQARRAILADHNGTPNVMLDERGDVTWSAEIGVWGDLRQLEGDRFACPFRWQGQYEDAETGLYYNRFRYYDPEAGEYASQDPIGLAGGIAPYAYVQDPLTWSDPLGLAGCGTSRAAATRRTQNAGDVTVRTERAARRQAMREHGMSTSLANNYERVPQYGQNPNLLGPNGEPSEVIRGLDLNGNPVEIQHHNHGHNFDDDGTFGCLVTTGLADTLATQGRNHAGFRRSERAVAAEDLGCGVAGRWLAPKSGRLNALETALLPNIFPGHRCYVWSVSDGGAASPAIKEMKRAFGDWPSPQIGGREG